MTVFEGFQLILNCDFVAVADRKYCQVFYGRERLLDEDVATYSFSDDVSFKKALKTATALSNSPAFEKLWSAKQFEDRPGGYICLKRKRGDSFLYHLHQANRTQQFKYCIKLVKALQKVHQQGRPHGGLDEDNVIFDERLKSPYLLEVLSGFFPDQLEPSLCAPEQKHEAPASFATDVYWLGNLYLSAIKRPNHKLRQLIRRCKAKDPEERPKLAEVAGILQEAYSRDIEISLRRWLLRPQKSIKLAGVGLLASAALIMSFDFIQFNKPMPKPSFKDEFRQDLSQTPLKASTLESLQTLFEKATSEDQLKFAVDSLVTKASTDHSSAGSIKALIKNRYMDEPISEYRMQIINGLSEINFSHDSLSPIDNWTVDSFEKSFIGVMIFDWPILITDKATYQLGDWVFFEGAEGYIFRIAMNHILIKNGPNIQKLVFETPNQLTKLDWQNKNIYIRGGQPNMRKVIDALYYLNFDIIDQGNNQIPGYIAGYFSFDRPEDFLQEVEEHLGIAFEGKTIWIQDIERLRTYIPVEHYYLKEPSCEDVFKTLLQFTGIDFRVDQFCNSPLSFLTTKTELKDVIQSLGYSWSLGTQPNAFEVTFFRKE